MPTALIVDDNPQDAYLLKCVLAADGFDCVEARNGREALERAAERPVDLVISDILMPVMDGFSLCREWKRRVEHRATPFVFYTATYVDRKDEDLARQVGADLFMVKPAEPAVLRRQLTEVLDKHRRGLPPAQGAGLAEEAPILRQYNAVLIRKLEEKLFELERANQALHIKDLALATSASGILITAPSGAVVYANPSMAKLCGRPVEALLAQPVESLFAEPERLRRHLTQPSLGAPLELQLAAKLEAGLGAWVQVSGHPVTDAQGSRLGTMLSCQDISDGKRLRQELARIQRLEALSLFAAGVAHDFNNLLMAIYAGLDLGALESAPELDDDSDRAMALAAFERARDLTRRLLEFSKGSTAKRKSVEVTQVLDESVALALSGSAVRCEKRYSAGLPRTWADPGQLAQVFSNLLVNARQALKDHGTVVVSASLTEAPGALPPGHVLCVRIEDDGPGIAPDVLPHVFEPYYTTKTEGSGLGLATSQAIVQEHGGLLSVVAHPGAGATFEVLLPPSREVGEGGFSTTPSPVPAAPARILVMDDQVGIQSLLQRGLERAGHSVVVTSNGEQALLEFERERARAGPSTWSSST